MRSITSAFGPLIRMKVRLTAMLSPFAPFRTVLSAAKELRVNCAKHLLLLQPQKQILRRSAPQDDMLGDFRRNVVHHSGRSSVTRWRAVTGALGLVMVLMPTMVATRPAQAPAEAPTYSVLYSFDPKAAAGTNPNGGLVRDAAGNLYGTTATFGLPGGNGTVFKLDPTGKVTVLLSFPDEAGGAYPEAGLTRDAAGNLYGTTSIGGSGPCLRGIGCGLVFKLDTTGKETVLHSFNGPPGDGESPAAVLTRDAAGNLYGTAYDVVFKIGATGKETLLHSFHGPPGDGESPQAGLTRDAAGNLYGTTTAGGSGPCVTSNGSGCGVVFKVDPTGKETVLHSFAGYPVDGAIPYSSLARDTAGNLYGTTADGGAFGDGAVFKLDTSGKLTLLHSFSGGADGANPIAGLLRDAAGNLYGTDSSGGSGCFGLGCGVVFKLDTTGKETVLHSFDGTDGRLPNGGLLRDAAGNLYGTTRFGGASDNGVVFKLTP